jgi:hypothetical protein
MFSRIGCSFGPQRLAASALSIVVIAAAMAVVGAGALALNTRSAAGAGSGGCFATGTPVCTFKDRVASAGFGSASPDGCIVTEAFVDSFEGLASPGNISTTNAFVGVAKFNACTNTLVESASNFDPATGNPVFNGTIQFGPRLDTASVSGLAPMFDDLTGVHVFTATVNLTWQGFGPTTTFIDGSHDRMPGLLLNLHSMGTSREALASGVVTDETGANLATPPTLKADLEDDTSGFVQVSRS